MSLKIKQAIILIISLFLGGNLLMIIGFTKGMDMAVQLSKPRGASGWTTSNEMVTAATYIPVIIGISLIVLSIAFSTVLFINWIKE